jgi:DNA-binding NtrC family response regulator
MQTILVLDSDRSLGLGTALEEMLGSALRLEASIRRVDLTTAADPLPPGAEAGTGAGAALAGILAVLSPAMLGESALLLRRLADRAPAVPVIAVLTRHGGDEVEELLDLGVQDFLVPPLRAGDVLPRLRRWLRPRLPAPVEGQSRDVVDADGAATAAGAAQRLGAAGGGRHPHLIGDSPCFRAALEKLPLVAACNAAVLISGETGTGKELFARSIHYLSPRAKKPFVAVNCGAIPTELVENELFGHERAAYTGAGTQRAGLVQEAEGGTLLLDEVDSLPLLAQVKLLRLLQEKEYRPLGSPRVQRADVRVLAATNGDVAVAVAAGRLRQDLYYRLNVIPLRLPPLRERRQDIPLLIRHFLAKLAHEAGRPAARFTPAAIERLLAHDWPGNVRELEHAVERALILTPPGEPIGDPQLGPPPQTAVLREGFQQAKARAVAQFESDYIRGLLLATGGNISRAAKAAEKNRRAFWELIRKHQIDAESFRPAR